VSATSGNTAYLPEFSRSSWKFLGNTEASDHKNLAAVWLLGKCGKQ